MFTNFTFWTRVLTPDIYGAHYLYLNVFFSSCFLAPTLPPTDIIVFSVTGTSAKMTWTAPLVNNGSKAYISPKVSDFGIILYIFHIFYYTIFFIYFIILNGVFL